MGVLENATSDTNRLAGRNATSALNRCPEKNPEDIRSRVVSDLVDLTATLMHTPVQAYGSWAKVLPRHCDNINTRTR